MLSGYPFYVNGPDPMEIAKVAESVKTTLKNACCNDSNDDGDNHQHEQHQVVIAVDRMGSSAIDGMAGTPVCDMLAQIRPWPLTDKAKARLVDAGYECKGEAPHTANDEWFFGGIRQDIEPGHLGRVCLHTVPEKSEFVRDMKAFVEYVKSHPDAFQRYNNVKVEVARRMAQSSEEEGLLLGYKEKKSKVCNEIKKEAIEWWLKKTRDSK